MVIGGLLAAELALLSALVVFEDPWDHDVLLLCPWLKTVLGPVLSAADEEGICLVECNLGLGGGGETPGYIDKPVFEPELDSDPDPRLSSNRPSFLGCGTSSPNVPNDSSLSPRLVFDPPLFLGGNASPLKGVNDPPPLPPEAP